MTEYRFDEDEVLKEELVLTKLDVARRQINTAVRMFLFDWDVVSCHTVATAGQDVIRNLAKGKGIERSIKDSKLVPPEGLKEFREAVSYSQNFFKHAGKDADVSMVFRFNGNAFYIADAIVSYVAMTQQLTSDMKSFLLWFQLRYPNLLCVFSEEYLSQIRTSAPDAEAFKRVARNLILEEDRVGGNQSVVWGGETP